MMNYKEKIHLVGCRNDLASTKCKECGFTFNHQECECFRNKTNRKLIWHYWAFRQKNFLGD